MSITTSRPKKIEKEVTKQRLVASEMSIKATKVICTTLLKRDPSSREQRKVLTNCTTSLQGTIDKYSEDICDYLANQFIRSGYHICTQKDGEEREVSPDQLTEFFKIKLADWKNPILS